MTKVIMGYTACDVCRAMREGPPFAKACEIELIRIFPLGPGHHIAICNACRCKLLGCDGQLLRIAPLSQYVRGAGRITVRAFRLDVTFGVIPIDPNGDGGYGS